MNQKNPANRYSALSIGIHWLMLLWLVAVYGSMELREFFPKGSAPREAMKMWHFMLGLSVLALVLIRLAGRATGSTPAIQPAPPNWQVRLGRAMHLGLYAWMIGMPLLGWLLLSAAGKPIPFFGLHLPVLMGASKELASQVKEVHEALGSAGYFLIGLHAAAGLFHHYALGDNTLRRMLPFRTLP